MANLRSKEDTLKSFMKISALVYLVAGIAFATSIWWFDSGEREYNIMNTHCTYNKFENPIGQVWEMIK